MAFSVSKRPLLISKSWPQAVILVFLFGFFIMGLLCYRSYTAGPPIPGNVISPTGEVLFTAGDIQEGQKIFLRNGLMEYGSIFGHGAYLGPDYTADYLRRSANIVEESYRGMGDAQHIEHQFGISIYRVLRDSTNRLRSRRCRSPQPDCQAASIHCPQGAGRLLRSWQRQRCRLLLHPCSSRRRLGPQSGTARHSGT